MTAPECSCPTCEAARARGATSRGISVLSNPGGVTIVVSNGRGDVDEFHLNEEVVVRLQAGLEEARQSAFHASGERPS